MHAASSWPRDSLPLILMLSAAAVNNIINNNGMHMYYITRIAPIILGPAKSAMPWVYCYLPMILN